ncbi:hypothetical protein [Lederbergia citrea]|uniref:hypothetical protein n=1 Tax=Lederbergia citrea TaxID=2833581 RepID=UPI001BCA59D9|nr:hypothetical protein [Lederbergia citrea]MBS4203656.1 hypothetical protein [Lederbergia citrea]
MDVFLRNIDVVAVKKIDDLAKKKKLSRNEYLKLHIEKLAHTDVLLEERNRFEETLKMVSRVLERNVHMMKENNKEIQRMKSIFMLMMEVNEEEVNEYMKVFVADQGEVV